MVLPIEDQIHTALKAQEEERCRALEAEYRRSEPTKSKEVKRRKVAKPWKRSQISPQALCPLTDLLLLVTNYDYDLSDPDFQAYCRSRGMLYVAGTPGSKRWLYSEQYGRTRTDFLSEPFFQYAREVDGEKHEFTKDEMEIHWKIMCVARAQLQDCWELFCRRRSNWEG